MSKKTFGKYGERLVADYLNRRGFVIIGANIHNKYGEIDILAEKDNILHFVEVKTRSSKTNSFPEDGFTTYKQLSVIRCIAYFMDLYDHWPAWQVDFAGLIVNKHTRKAYICYKQNIRFDSQVVDKFLTTY